MDPQGWNREDWERLARVLDRLGDAESKLGFYAAARRRYEQSIEVRKSHLDGLNVPTILDKIRRLPVGSGAEATPSSR